jgi:hypothetical protein
MSSRLAISQPAFRDLRPGFAPQDMDKASPTEWNEEGTLEGSFFDLLDPNLPIAKCEAVPCISLQKKELSERIRVTPSRLAWKMRFSLFGLLCNLAAIAAQVFDCDSIYSRQ